MLSTRRTPYLVYAERSLTKFLLRKGFHRILFKSYNFRGRLNSLNLSEKVIYLNPLYKWFKKKPFEIGFALFASHQLCFAVWHKNTLIHWTIKDFFDNLIDQDTEILLDALINPFKLPLCVSLAYARPIIESYMKG